MTSTHTLATLPVSLGAYQEIKRLLVEAGQEDRIYQEGNIEAGISLHGVMVTIGDGDVDEKLEAGIAEALAASQEPKVTYSLDNPPKGYADLAGVLTLALQQSAKGKGKERHARGDTPFDRQPIMEIPRMVGPSGTAYQVMKKSQEAMRMEPRDAINEMLGAIVYAAATILIIKEQAEMDGRLAAGDDPIPEFLTRNKG